MIYAAQSPTRRLSLATFVEHFASASFSSRAVRFQSPALRIQSAIESFGSIRGGDAMVRRPRPPRGERRIEVAMNHLSQEGFGQVQIRNAIYELLQVYGRNGWPFLEEGSYHIVRNKLMEQQAQQAQGGQQAHQDQGEQPAQQDQVEQQAQQDQVEQQAQQDQVEQQAQQDQKLEAAAAEGASQNGMEVSQVPVPPAKGPCAGPSCYGWINEESETESEEDGEMLSDAGPVIFGKKDIPNPTLPSERK